MTVALRVTLIAPTPGVQFCLQSGRKNLIAKTVATGEDIRFDLELTAARAAREEVPRFSGPLVQGRFPGQFVYVCSGTCAGQDDSCWTRRAKVPLSGIRWGLVEKAQGQPGARLEARFAGQAKDGGPACATIRPLNGGWRLCHE
ncbi:MAG: DUF5990 family protein [Bryobacteraceae bacterium]